MQSFDWLSAVGFNFTENTVIPLGQDCYNDVLILLTSDVLFSNILE